MPNEDQESKRSRDYVVGYKRPPEATRFRKGQSGNPAGRPKGTRNLKDDLADELRETILVREGEQTKKISKQRAFLKSLMARALKGDTRAIATLLNTVLRVFNMEEPLTETRELSVDEKELIEVLETRLLQRRALRSNEDEVKDEEASDEHANDPE